MAKNRKLLEMFSLSFPVRGNSMQQTGRGRGRKGSGGRLPRQPKRRASLQLASIQCANSAAVAAAAGGA